MSRTGSKISRLRQSLVKKPNPIQVDTAKQIALEVGNDARDVLVLVGVDPAIADQARTRILNIMRKAVQTVP